MATDYGNPIDSVNGTEVPCPSAYTFTKQDISMPGAGRTEDGTMWKLKIGEKVKIELSWSNVNDFDAVSIFSAFNDSEYLTVVYFNPMKGTHDEGVFYIGDMSTAAYNRKLGIWTNISFNIIEQ